MADQHPFNEEYFKTGPYERVSFARFSQYWWSNRFYARLAVRYGPPGGKVLEVGCGLGHLLAWLATRYEVVGTDINEPALRQARLNVPEGTFMVLSAEDLEVFPNGHFQIVIAKHVVEHLHQPEQAVSEMSRVLSRGGILILATPNLDSPMRALKGGGWVGYQDPTHVNLKRPGEWLNMLRGVGLKPLRVFSDGFWDAPYIPVLPVALQKVIFGAPGGLQAVLGWSIIPLRLGESLIAIARKMS